MELVVGVLVGFATGVFASLFTTWLLLHGVRSKIEFAPEVSIHDGRLRLKVRNASRRTLTEVETWAVFRTASTDSSLPNNRHYVQVPVDDGYMPTWPAFRKSGTEKVFVLLADDLSRHDRELLGTTDLPGLLSADKRNTFHVVVTFTDVLTGSRRVVASPTFGAEAARPATYEIGAPRVDGDRPTGGRHGLAECCARVAPFCRAEAPVPGLQRGLAAAALRTLIRCSRGRSQGKRSQSPGRNAPWGHESATGAAMFPGCHLTPTR